jgi:hypothetical protein
MYVREPVQRRERKIHNIIEVRKDKLYFSFQAASMPEGKSSRSMTRVLEEPSDARTVQKQLVSSRGRKSKGVLGPKEVPLTKQT